MLAHYGPWLPWLSLGAAPPLGLIVSDGAVMIYLLAQLGRELKLASAARLAYSRPHDVQRGQAPQELNICLSYSQLNKLWTEELD